jgi:hypothetical protein
MDASKLNGKSGHEALSYILTEDRKFEWYAWRYLLRMDYLKEKALFFIPGRYYEDVNWTPRVFYEANKVWYVDVIGVQYWFHNPGSILNTPNIKKSIDKIEIAATSCELAQQAGLEKKTEDIVCETFAKLYLSGFGDYLNGKKELSPYLQKNKEVLSYSHTLYGRTVRVLTNFFGFRLASVIIRQYIRLKKKGKKS